MLFGIGSALMESMMNDEARRLDHIEIPDFTNELENRRDEQDTGRGTYIVQEKYQENQVFQRADQVWYTVRREF
jgi:hypothetical protein